MAEHGGIALGEIRDLLGGDLLEARGEIGTRVTGVTHDSREVRPGDLYLAIAGARFDGHSFLDDARQRGAVAAVVEGVERLAGVPEGMPALAVAETRQAMARIAAAVYRTPSRELDLLGVTGTNGKSSTCYLLDGIARAGGRRSGLFTTLEIRMPGGSSLSAARTTPEATTLQHWLRKMADDGAEQVAMEVSSHALDLDRVGCTEFAGIVFSNLTQDHLDWHGTMEDYFLAKTRLFTRAVYGRPSCVGAVNVDDPYGRRLATMAECRVVRFAMEADADVRAREVHLAPDHTALVLQTPEGAVEVRLQLLGRFAAWNALAAAALEWGRGRPVDEIVAGLEGLSAVPGRLERVGTDAGPTVLVDYAHTPASLESVLSSVREFARGRVICVFGCGGDRDNTKRAPMGRAVAQGADVPIVTSDNPRSEDPDAVIDMIVPGLQGKDYLRTADRREAIFRAVGLAGADDLVVIAGKGHETYQEFRDGTVHFDDREVAAEALAGWTSGGAR